ncbi:Rne/Rng family ribonuclease [Bartonella sp. CB189]|uniref:Rne/Rng family ribonuclease n=1 Tax=Bartonella sp. CB189 TaxID=3112254 RepID=UPI002F96BE09
MSNKMLIDASHPEETRVVVVHGNKIEELDFESEHKKQLKGNIYLARITRVEPSLQAAFIEYGGNRHGFLTFSEIHPDYYQIPIADRLALLEEEEKAAAKENHSENLAEDTHKNKQRSRKIKKNESNQIITAAVEDDTISEEITIDDEETFDTNTSDDDIEMVGLEDVHEEFSSYQRRQERQYKIQEVIKRRQILLVQVIKEERGNKGAALTTYLSLAGRYSVLMPNTARGGGISRKITNIQDRKRLKEIVKELSVPKGMGVILRTAGANRTKAEIKRDYEYLTRLWDTIRTLTLQSTAPCLVHEESSLIKRSIRDLYNKSINEILVSGDQGYREAKDFMRMLMPSHAKVVQPYRDPTPIFARNNIETQLDKILLPQVFLKSGGYLVINQTEALVAIDVNSGRSTKEHSVEKTALQTNLEAAEEIARQLRLRDLAGLIVIDFIDMLEERNVRMVEKKLKDCLKSDRARIQVGHISHFGLLEMSRQRIRVSVLESTMQPCTHCAGTGSIRSESSIALHVIRSIEEYLLHNPQHNIIVRTPAATALYVLNHKRNILVNLEMRFKLNISIEADDSIGTQHLTISKSTIAEAVAQSTLFSEDNDKEKIDNAIFKNSEDTEDEVSTKTNQKHRRKNHQKEINSNAVLAPHKKDDDSNDEDLHRRGRRRGRSGNRRNQDNSFYQPRIPSTEPVGDFAKKALEEVKKTNRKRRTSMITSVGFEELKNDTKRSNMQQNEVAETDVAMKSKKRRIRSSKEVKSKQIPENDQSITTAEILEEKVTDNSKHKKVKIKQIDEPIHEVKKEAPANVTKKTRRIRKKLTSKEETQKIPEQETMIEKVGEAVLTKTEGNANEPIIKLSTSNDVPKTKRVGWWKRRILSKN